MCKLSDFFRGKTSGEEPAKPKPTDDLPSPRDIIPKSDISHNSLTCVLEIRHIPPSVWLADVGDTKSMDPTIDVGHTAILTNNFLYGDLAVGDIVVYQVYTKLIMHRIFKIEADSKGNRKYTFKCDRVDYPDPHILGDKYIKWLLLGVIY